MCTWHSLWCIACRSEGPHPAMCLALNTPAQNYPMPILHKVTSHMTCTYPACTMPASVTTFLRSQRLTRCRKAVQFGLTTILMSTPETGFTACIDLPTNIENRCSACSPGAADGSVHECCMEGVGAGARARGAGLIDSLWYPSGKHDGKEAHIHQQKLGWN